MTRAITDERGHTLIELMMAMVLGIIALLAAYMVMDGGVRGYIKTEDRVDAIARGRLAMEQTVRALRSQICPNITVNNQTLRPLIAAEDNRVRFYGSLSTDPTTDRPVVEVRELTFAAGTLREDVYTPVAADGTVPAQPTRSRVLAGSLSAPQGRPFFRYFAFTGDPPRAVTPLATPLSAANRLLAAQLDVAFVTAPESGRNIDTAAPLSGRVFIRTADPSAPETGPRCV